MQKIIKLALTDFKLIFRNPSLSAFFAFPFILYGLVIWFLPAMVEEYDFLLPYLPVFLIIGVIENTQMFSFISSMVLIDEKETDVAKLYGVVPLSRIQYLFSRLTIPFLITTLLNVGLLAIQPFYTLTWLAIISISLLTALVVPVYVLGINAIVKNRMQGMVYIKAFNMLVLIPIAAFFLPPALKPVFGFLPTHWIFQSIEKAIEGLSIVLTTGIGFLYFLLLMYAVSKMFLRKHFL